MKLKLPNLDFNKESHREFIIQYITNIINQNPKDENFKLQCIGISKDKDFWSVDPNNCWRIFFREGCNNVIDVFYSHESKTVKAEKALCKWLCFALNAEIID